MAKSKRLLATVLSSIILFAMFAVPVSASAAAKPKLNKTKATVTRTKSIKLTLKNATASKVKWSSSKKSIATVNKKGKVTGKKAGKATITAKYKGKKYKCKVTVKGRVINKNKTFNVAKGGKITVKLTNSSGKTLTVKKWKSSNSSIASITSKGVVTGKKAGTVTITATDKYGDMYKCKVKVTDPAVTLKNYLQKNGTRGSDGNYYIEDYYTAGSGNTKYYANIEYNAQKKQFEFWTNNEFDVAYCLEMDIPYAGASKYPTIYFGVDSDDNLAFDSSATINPATYDINTDLTFELEYGSINYNDLQNFANMDLWYSMCIWEDMLKPAGLTMASFGFVRF